MPIKKCSANGTSGFKWGDSGHCYTGPDAKKNAIKQGLAIGGGKLKASDMEEITTEELEAATAELVQEQIKEYMND